VLAVCTVNSKKDISMINKNVLLFDVVVCIVGIRGNGFVGGTIVFMLHKLDAMRINNNVGCFSLCTGPNILEK
jgi:hypothetical protein